MSNPTWLLQKKKTVRSQRWPRDAPWCRLFHPTSTTLRGFDSERISADRTHRIDRMLILNVTNSSVTSSTQRRMPSINTQYSTSSNLIFCFCAPDPTPIPTKFWGCSRWNRSSVLGSVWEGTLIYSAVKLFSKYSNLCEKHAWTSQTDGETDRQMTYCGITALRSIGW